MRVRSTMLLWLSALSLAATACGSTVPMTTQVPVVVTADGTGTMPTDGDPTLGAPANAGSTGGAGSVAGASGSTSGPSAGGAAGTASGATTGATSSGSTSSGGQVSSGGTSSGGTSSGGTSSGGTSSGGTGSGGTASGGTASPTRAPVPATGPGWDEKFVYIGVTTQKDSQAVFASVGYDNVDPGDTEAQAQAMADELNAAGGVFGRQVALVFRDHALLDTANDPNGTAAQTCTYFTQDRPVIAVINIVTLLDVPNFRACLANAGTPLFSASFEAVDDGAAFGLRPHFYQTVAVSWTRLAPVMVAQLEQLGWFTGWNATTATEAPGEPVIGILIDNTDVGGRVADAIKGSLAKAGHTDVLVYSYEDRTQGQNSSVLYFAGNNVTHIIVTNVEMLAFQNSAAGQNYRPRYGVSTFNAPFTNLESSSPAGQNVGAMGVGFSPVMDVSGANQPAVSGGGQKACLDRQAANGQSFAGKALAASLAYAICDSFWLIGQGATVGGGFTPQAMLDGITQMGSSYAPASGFGTTRIGPSSLFVPGTARGMVWGTDCSCFTYASPETPL